jgi:hypothetical protein
MKYVKGLTVVVVKATSRATSSNPRCDIKK